MSVSGSNSLRSCTIRTPGVVVGDFTAAVVVIPMVVGGCCTIRWVVMGNGADTLTIGAVVDKVTCCGFGDAVVLAVVVVNTMLGFEPALDSARALLIATSVLVRLCVPVVVLYVPLLLAMRKAMASLDVLCAGNVHGPFVWGVFTVLSFPKLGIVAVRVLLRPLAATVVFADSAAPVFHTF